MVFRQVSPGYLAHQPLVALRKGKQMARHITWRRTLAVSTAVAVVAATSAFAGLPSGRGRGKRHHRGRGGVTAVEVARAVSGTAVSQLTLSGLVSAAAAAPIAAGVGGRVQSVSVSIGSQVVAGQSLVTLSNPVLQAQLVAAQAAVATAQAKLAAAQAGPTPQAIAVGQAQVAKAQAALAAAQAAYQAGASTHSSGSGKAGTGSTGSQSGNAQAAATVAQAQASLTLAEAQLAQLEAPANPTATGALSAGVAQAQAGVGVVEAQLAQEDVVAPFAGTVTALPAIVGEQVSAGTTLAIVQGDALQVQAPLDQQQLTSVVAGQPASISVPASPQRIVGYVGSVSPAASPTSLAFTVTVDLSTAPSWLRAGESALVTVSTHTQSGAVIIPTSAIVYLNGTPQVFVVSSSAKVGLVDVTPGLSDGTDSVVSGLPVGARVVTAGQTYLATGSKVRVSSTTSVPTTVSAAQSAGLSATAPLTTPSPSSGTAAGGKGGKAVKGATAAAGSGG